eukprot:scaffold174550_cov13-Cyclotella_meneghiniana.AAC.1
MYNQKQNTRRSYTCQQTNKPASPAKNAPDKKYCRCIYSSAIAAAAIVAPFPAVVAVVKVDLDGPWQ